MLYNSSEKKIIRKNKHTLKLRAKKIFRTQMLLHRNGVSKELKHAKVMLFERDVS